MQVIWHQDIGVDGDMKSPCGLTQPIQQGLIVAVIMKYQATVVTALNDVMRLTRDNKTRKARHGND